MSDSQTEAGWQIIAATIVAVCFGALVLYLGCYFFLSRSAQWIMIEDGVLKFDGGVRVYRQRWQAQFYSPLAKFESTLTGEVVRTAIESDDESVDFVDRLAP